MFHIAMNSIEEVDDHHNLKLCTLPFFLNKNFYGNKKMYIKNTEKEVIDVGAATLMNSIVPAFFIQYFRDVERKYFV